MKRLGFLGAFNRDIVAHASGAAVIAALSLPARPLVETAISDAAAGQGADHLAALGADVWLGGSAFNALRVAALLNAVEPKVALSAFGISGRVDLLHPHLDALAQWSVDIAGVTAGPVPPATCLALVEPAGRTLLTASGANAGIAAWLSDNAETLASGIARCDILHVTSYLDPKAPGLIADILALARRINPRLVVSLDPGTLWVMGDAERLAPLLAASDILHLNTEELTRLCGSADPDEASLETLAHRLRPERVLLVTRSHVGAAMHQFERGRRITTQTLPEMPLPPPDRVLDATGAGDTFCGGFLWSLLARAADAPTAAALGFALARAKIATNGPLSDGSALRGALGQP